MQTNVNMRKHIEHQQHMLDRLRIITHTTAAVSADDHEVADNASMGGATNHNPGEGSWSERMTAGLRAWWEYMPVRQLEKKGSGQPRRYRDFKVNRK